ncbi:unnamed protein product [Phytophthora fragariaefolia]|uniref:Unnamed protein product n=1 Tax=Phytophthora fragariaefolia TaxID=1490495 RepID=A0A9W6XHZ5_9STRA|nr:unnamed protein product [Phytophthora fragariaefolia]
MTAQGPAKTADAATSEAGPPTTPPAPADVPAPDTTTTVDVVDVTTDGAAKGQEELVRGAGLPASQATVATTTEERATTAKEISPPITMERPGPAPKTTTRQPMGFDLTDFMTSFQPGLATEARLPAQGRDELSQAAKPPRAEEEVQRLHQELECLRGQDAGVRQSLVVLTKPNDQGELPADSVQQLTSGSFPEHAKKAKGDNFASDFSPSANLPTAATSCHSYDDILDGIHGLARMGESMWHDHMLMVTERLRVFVSKTKSADPGGLPSRVKLVLLYVNSGLVRHSITFKSTTRPGGAVSAGQVHPQSRYKDSREHPGTRANQGRRKKSVPDDIQALIPSNRRGEELCLRFLGGVMCHGGTRDRCGHHKRIHGWPSADIPRRLKDWAQDTYTRRRGWDQDQKLGSRKARY